MRMSPVRFRSSKCGLWSHTDLTLLPNNWITLGRLLNLSKGQPPCVERVDTARLTAVLGKASLQGWPLISGGFSPLTDESKLYKHGFCFPLRVWNWGLCLARVPMWPSLSKNPRHWVSNELPWLATLHVCYSSLLGECVLCLYWERTLEACAWSFPDFIPCAFPLCWFCSAAFHCNKSRLWVLLGNHRSWE